MDLRELRVPLPCRASIPDADQGAQERLGYVLLRNQMRLQGLEQKQHGLLLIYTIPPIYYSLEVFSYLPITINNKIVLNTAITHSEKLK